jgi:glutamate-1-semialdehyde 2,1-aminomutase
VNALGERMREGLTEVVADRVPEYTVVGTDSMFKLVFTRADSAPQSQCCAAGCTQDSSCARYDECPKDGSDVANAETDRWERLFWPAMKDEGIFLTPNQFESQFVSYAHTEADVDRTIEAYERCL